MPKFHAVPPAEVSDLARECGFELPPGAAHVLSDYLGLLMQWNKAMNLVGTSTWRQTFQELVLDSLHLALFLESLDLPPMPQSWDLGAGAGMPGIPLRAVWQRGEYWLVESREKRALFLSTVLARCPLPGTRVFRGRAESFLAGPPLRYADLVVSRAFMPWSRLLGLIRAHLTPGGCAVLLLQKPLIPDLLCGWETVACLEYPMGHSCRAFAAVRPIPASPYGC